MKCGESLPEDAKFCFKCGDKTTINRDDIGSISRATLNNLSSDNQVKRRREKIKKVTVGRLLLSFIIIVISLYLSSVFALRIEYQAYQNYLANKGLPPLGFDLYWDSTRSELVELIGFNYVTEFWLTFSFLFFLISSPLILVWRAKSENNQEQTTFHQNKFRKDVSEKEAGCEVVIDESEKIRLHEQEIERQKSRIAELHRDLKTAEINRNISKELECIKILIQLGEKGLDARHAELQDLFRIRNQKIKKGLYFALAIIGVVIIGKVLIGMISVKKDNSAWEKAESTGTVVAFETYKREHPEGRFTYEAESEIERIKSEDLKKEAAAQLEKKYQSLVKQAANALDRGDYKLAEVIVKGAKDIRYGEELQKIHERVQSFIAKELFEQETIRKTEEKQKAEEKLFADKKREQEREELVEKELVRRREEARLNEEKRTREEERRKASIETAINEIENNMVIINNKFSMGKYEVTQGQWQAIMGNNPSQFRFGDNYPVESVSRNNCQAFLRKLNQISGKRYRLPTESEWNSAFGKTNKKIDTIAWYAENSGKTTHPVGQKEPNKFGLYDMLGNVAEWCEGRNGLLGHCFTSIPSTSRDSSHGLYNVFAWFSATPEGDRLSKDIGFRLVMDI
jgi:formylglycine-generating enzyme required for sulfatase activity